MQLYYLITTFSDFFRECRKAIFQNPHKIMSEKVWEKCILYVVLCLKTLFKQSILGRHWSTYTFVASIYLPLIFFLSYTLVQWYINEISIGCLWQKDKKKGRKIGAGDRGLHESRESGTGYTKIRFKTEISQMSVKSRQIKKKLFQKTGRCY